MQASLGEIIWISAFEKLIWAMNTAEKWKISFFIEMTKNDVETEKHSSKYNVARNLNGRSSTSISAETRLTVYRRSQWNVGCLATEKLITPRAILVASHPCFVSIKRSLIFALRVVVGSSVAARTLPFWDTSASQPWQKTLWSFRAWTGAPLYQTTSEDKTNSEKNLKSRLFVTRKQILLHLISKLLLRNCSEWASGKFHFFSFFFNSFWFKLSWGRLWHY